MLALGVYPDVSLADARARRDEVRKLLANGIDPGDKKKNDKVEQEEACTFEELAVEMSRGCSCLQQRTTAIIRYDTKVEVCGHGFRTMACSSLIELGLWSKDAVERQISHMERNSVRAAYIHKAEHLDESKLMLQWWADFLDANREKAVSPFDFAKLNMGR